MRRRKLLALLGAGIVLPHASRTHAQARTYRIGTLFQAAPVSDKSPFGAALLAGLGRHGYVLDRNLVIERRGAEHQLDRLPGLVTELVERKVEVIVALGYAATLAAKQGTTVPVVSFSAGDPVGTGLVESLARPGGNVTGVSDVSAEITPKRLELLREVAPGLRRVAILYNAADPGMTLRYRASEAGAAQMGISVQSLGLHRSEDFAAAFEAMRQDKPDAILVVSDPLTAGIRAKIFEFAATHRLPGIYEHDQHVRAGGLMSYGPDIGESFDRIAALIDKILKGRKPADLPFEQPTLFKFVINQRAAKALSLAISPNLLERADEVIE
jgi:putative tryptophan/tyrosine transport system substrate-binding protein